jgi:iron complex outermembrane receptor protein
MVVNLNATRNVGWGENGFLQFAAEFRDRGYTNRSLPDRRTQYFTGDVKNTDPLLNNQINHRQGDAETRDLVGFLNLGKQIGSTTELYGTIGWSRRRGEAAGFWRRANDNRTVRAIYPDGFLPLIESIIYDGSAVAGLRGETSGWDWDVSAGYGRNSFTFDVKNSANVSLGEQSPTEFYAGTLAFGQFTGNLGVVKGFNVGLASKLSVAVGTEFRSDHYEINEGEPDSYRNGGVNVLDGPNAGSPSAIGAQVFPGFTPTDAVSKNRNSVAGYVDFEANVFPELVVGAAARAEYYSDFGGTGDYKLSARFEPIRGLAFRAATSTGFRAPSLGQSWFASTSTNFVAGVPTDNRTFPVSDPVALALGAQPLEPETSHHISVGAAIYPTKRLSITADYYKISIKDRIVLSGTFNQAAVVSFLEAEGFVGVGGARFFTNAIDTRTAGFDIVVGYGFPIFRDGNLRIASGYNRTKTEVTHVEPTPGVLAAFSETLFDRQERARVEKGQPRDNFSVSGIVTKGHWVFNYRAQRFGAVTSFGTLTDGSLDQEFRAKLVSDASVAFAPNRALVLMLGADNIWDVYPDQNNNNGPIDTDPTTTNGGNGNFGIFPYNGISPFGFNGRFVYLRVTWSY